jgi:ATP-dependent Lon protease
VTFGYRDNSGSDHAVKTLEEELYPRHYAQMAHRRANKEHHLTFQENQQGVTYDGLFGPYLYD